MNDLDRALAVLRYAVILLGIVTFIYLGVVIWTVLR